ncbi:MAG: FAD-dependent oxidoreductase, partial [Chitinophagales bacterium]|nr:FAD-dependent oxidoreductase [Chitinophagales bacterium]MDW8273013.1 FAD-dependent oxidoreductase [Chitinophagales bacterium]
APVKGEALKIIPKNYSIRDHIWGSANIFPLDEAGKIFYAGSTYEWNFKDEFPTQEKREELINKIRKTIFSTFEIVEHVSGVRPAMADRRPVMGLIPESRIGLFNGFGTKGFSLAPYFSKVFCGYLAESNSLPDSVNLKRFQ